MIPLIKVRERGAAPRGMKRIFNEASALAWHDTAKHWHEKYRDKRFTPEHAEKAGYTKRKGQLQPRGSAAFRKSYMGKKLRMYGHQNPLELTGESRRAARLVTIKSTRKAGTASYRGLRKFNFRHPKSRVRMSEEFKRILPDEARELADFYDDRLDFHLAQQDKAAGG